MKTLVHNILILGLFAFLQFQPCHAQKHKQEIVFYNSETFLNNWSEWQSMESQVFVYQDSLDTVLKMEMDAFHQRLQDFQELAKYALWCETEYIQQMKPFMEEEQQILNQKKAIDSLVMVRQNQLEFPLKDKLKTALQAIAAKENYAYIIDESKIAFYFKEAQNITLLLRETLGFIE